MGVLIRNRQAERFVIEGSHPLEIADPHEDRLELRIGQWTGHRFRHRVTTGTWESSVKSVSATTPCGCLRPRGPSPHTRPSATTEPCTVTGPSRRAPDGRTGRPRRAPPWVP